MFGIGANELLILVVGFVLYFLPSIIAKTRNHEKYGAILALNFLTGWTIMGWIACFIWAVVGNKVPKEGEIKKCPFCAEIIKNESIICKHCNKELEAAVKN